MHELSIANAVYRIGRDAAGDGKLTWVSVAVGELSAVEPELLRFAWEAVTAGTPDAGARLDVDWRPARQLCAACGEVAERAPGSWLRLCPRCQDPLRVEGGDELLVLKVGYETADESAAEAAAGLAVEETAAGA